MTARHRGFSLRSAVPAALVAGTAAVLLGTATPAPPAQAAPTTCKATEVTVVVTGQGTGCARAGLTGTESLKDAGFRVTKVQTQPGFVCRIGGAPADDPCINTPPASAYWAYYYAPLGGEWTYSPLGADNRRATAGTAEAWAFGNGARPGPVPDPPAAAPKTTTQRAPASTRTQTVAPRTRAARPATEAAAAPAPVEVVPDAAAPADSTANGTRAESARQSAADPGDQPGAAVGSDPRYPDTAAPQRVEDPAPGETALGETAPDEAALGEEAFEGAGLEGEVDGAEFAATDPDGSSPTADDTEVMATGVREETRSPWPYVAVGGLLIALAAAGVMAARRFRQ